jgi:hypothetical protein
MSFDASNEGENDEVVARALEGAVAAGIPVATSAGNNAAERPTSPCGYVSGAY